MHDITHMFADKCFKQTIVLFFQLLNPASYEINSLTGLIRRVVYARGKYIRRTKYEKGNYVNITREKM